MRLLLALLYATLMHANASAEAHDDRACAPDGIGVGGYDLVSYHHEDGPVAGVDEFAEQANGVTYLFRNAQNLETFRAHPEKYLPTYFGWCATTLAMGRLTCPDPINFKIEDGRLLLFELAGFTNGRSLWNADPVDFKERADANFMQLVK